MEVLMNFNRICRKSNGQLHIVTLAIVCLSIVVCSLPSQAEVTINSQRRQLTTFSLISYVGEESVFCTDDDLSLDPGVYENSIHCHVDDQGNSATANSAQLSYIFPHMILAEGSFEAFADISGGADFAEGLSSSGFKSEFYVDEVTQINILATLSASGNGSANITFRIKNGQIFIYRSIHRDMESVDETIDLAPGLYEFSLGVSGPGQALPDGDGEPASGSYSGSVSFPASAVVLDAAMIKSPLAPVAAPNPLRGETRLFPAIDGRSASEDLVVLDVSGRVIRNFRSVGQEGVVWDGRDENGRSVGGGVYLARGGNGASTRMILIR